MGRTIGKVNCDRIRSSLKMMANKCHGCGAKIRRGDIHYIGLNVYCNKCFYEGKVKS